MEQNKFFPCGKTPLVQLERGLFVKIETGNPTGSVKDRVVQYIVKDAFERRLIDDNTILVEASSGNTGISLASLGARLGLKTKIVMPCDMSEERKQIIKSFGAELIEVGPGDFQGAIIQRNSLCNSWKHWSPLQFENPLNIICHRETTAKEIVRSLMGVKWSAFVSGVGTGGTLMGIHEFCKSKKYDVDLVKVEPGEKHHGIQGISDGGNFLFSPNVPHLTEVVSTDEAHEEMIEISKKHGLLVGMSSAANIICARRYIKNMSPEGAVVTLACDRGERYFSMR